MNHRISKYTLGIIGFNLLALLFLSLYLWKGWHYRVLPTMNLIFFKELVITFSTVPLYAIWISQLHSDKINTRYYKNGVMLFLFLLFVSIYGAGMHNSANQIRAVVNEPIVYFYDELLSHYIFMTALFGIGICLAWLQTNSPNHEKLSRLEKNIIVLSGIFQGLIMGVGSLEAHFGVYALVLSLAFAIAIYVRVRKSFINQFPLSWYYLFLFGSIHAFLLLSAFLNKGFIEPSVSGLGRF